MISPRVALLSLLVLSSIALAGDELTVSGGEPVDVVPLTDEEVLAAALKAIADPALESQLESCVDVNFLGSGCGRSGKYPASAPVCVPVTEVWPPVSCGDLFSSTQYTSMSLFDRYSYFRSCLSGDTNEGDRCLVPGI